MDDRLSSATGLSAAEHPSKLPSLAVSVRKRAHLEALCHQNLKHHGTSIAALRNGQ